jgi:ParB-like chromosome segregation protein Spo0J
METTPEYEYHRLSNLFPLMTDSEIAKLAEDIKVNGLAFPIILYDGKILDGRNRYLACRKAGVQPDFWEYEGDAPIQFVLSLNLERRHLTISQRAAIAAELATLPQGARTDLASNEARFSQQQAGDAMDVSRSSVQRAVEVRTADPELHEKVKAGEVSVEEARRAIPMARVDKEAEPDDETARQLAECEQVISEGLQKMQDQFPELPMEEIVDLMSNRSQSSALATESNDAVELPSPAVESETDSTDQFDLSSSDQCDSSHSDSDEPDIYNEFDAFVKRLSEQCHKTEWQIKSCIYGMLYFLNMTEGPYIPGQRWEP